MNRKLILVLLVAFATFPLATHAVTLCDQADINCALQQFATLNKESESTSLTPSERVQTLENILSVVTAYVAGLQTGNDQMIATTTCLSLSNTLVIGSIDDTTNGEVSKLQSFLHAAGVYPEAHITGYYGTLTAEAVVRWQTAHGIQPVTPSTGVGPMTRAAMKCDRVTGAETENSDASEIKIKQGDTVTIDDLTITNHGGGHEIQMDGNDVYYTEITLKTPRAESVKQLVYEPEKDPVKGTIYRIVQHDAYTITVKAMGWDGEEVTLEVFKTI